MLGPQGGHLGKGQRVIEMDQKLEANGPGEGSRKAVVQVWKPELQSSNQQLAINAGAQTIW